jgi:hypothetical protein
MTDITGAQAATDAIYLVHVVREHRGAQPIGRFVRDLHGMVDVARGDEREHRPENLFLRDGHLEAHTSV